MKKITGMLVVFACLTALLFSACRKDTTSTGNSALAVRLKDAPANWGRCMVDVRGIRLHSTTDGWITIPINDTIIDILQLQDTSALLGMVNLHAGVITEVHLLLGVRDSITIGGATFVVSVVPGDSDDIAIQVRDSILPSANFTLVLDLNAANSFGADNDGHWHMHGNMSGAFRRDDDHGGHH